MKTLAIIALATVIAAPAFAQSGTHHPVNTRAQARILDRAHARAHPQQQQTRRQSSNPSYNAFNSTSYNRAMRRDEPWNDDSEMGE